MAHLKYWQIAALQRKVKSPYYKTVNFLLFFHFRSQYFAENSVGFIIAVVTSDLITWMFIVAFKAFVTIYVGVCINIETFADDISTNVDRLNLTIAKKIKKMSIVDDLRQIVELHTHTYKYERNKVSNSMVFL